MKKLFVAMLTLIVALSIASVCFASSDSPIIAMSVKYRGHELLNQHAHNVYGGDTIKVNAITTESEIYAIGYYFEDDGYDSMTDIHDSTCEIVIPEMPAGSTKILWIEAITTDDDGTANTLTKTGWQQYNLNYIARPDYKPEMEVTYANEVISTQKTTYVTTNNVVTITAGPTDKITSIFFRWDNGNIMEITANRGYVELPRSISDGKEHYLDIILRYENLHDTKTMRYTFVEE